ncbi:hypothetical protein C1X64_27255 [Pseudomonas sp. GW456-E7]|nr:hypothetical protein C1X64_27255 [Pseudomonas sp. GW456-E7]
MRRCSWPWAPSPEEPDTKQNLWERACSRRGQHIQHPRRLIHRLREQARSHRGIAARRKSRKR